MSARWPRILTYSHDGFGLGHLRRNLRIAQALVSDLPSAAVLMAGGSPAAGSFPIPPQVDFLKLPSLSKVDNDHYVSAQLGLDRAGVSDLRAALLSATIKSFAPDLILVDFYPLGAQGELEQALREIRRSRPGTVTVFGCRDILDSPEQVRREWHETGQFAAVEELFDRVLVYGSRAVYDPIVEYGLPAGFARRVLFTGYLVEPGAPAPSRCSDPPTVVCTLGGGEDGQFLARSFLAAVEHLSDQIPNLQAMLVTGPLMPRVAGDEVRRDAARLGVSCREFERDMPALLASANAVVAMAGYNTVCEVLAAGTPTVLVPRVAPRTEQSIRARRLAELGLVRTLAPAEATPRALGGVLRDLIYDPAGLRPLAAVPAVHSDGLRVTAATLAETVRTPAEVA
jgi:predicted glycosyltransferase